LRKVAFRTEDAELDRWQALGLVVASLVTTEARPGEPTPGKPAPLPPSRDAVARAAERAVWIGVGGLAGNGLGHGPARYGGWLRAGYQIRRLPVFVALGTSYALAAPSAGVRPEWASLSLGAGALIELRKLRLGLRPAFELALEHIAARSEAPVSEGSSSGSRSLAASQAVLEITWPTGAPVALDVAGLAAFATGATGIRVAGSEVESFPAVAYAVMLGIDIEFLR